MARSLWRNRLPRPLKRWLGSIRRWVAYPFRVLLTSSFRGGATALRALHVLPRPAARNGELWLLIVNLSPHLGDAILQMPMIHALREANPGARIEFAVEESAAPLLRRMTELDHVYGLRLGQAPPVRAWQAMRRSLRVSRAYWKHMRRVSPDVCLLPRWDNDQFRSHVLAYLTGAPGRVGFGWNAVPGARAAPYRDAFLTEIARGGSGLHEAARYCLLAHESGFIRGDAWKDVSDRTVPALLRIAATENWPELAGRLGIALDRPFAVIAPGASRAAKMWPGEKWAVVCRSIEALGFNIVLMSGKSDAAIAESLYERNGRRGVLAAGKTSFSESVALLQHAGLFLGNDSGPGHVAGGLGIPTVVLFATVDGHDPDSAAPQRIRPPGPLVQCCCPPQSLKPCEGICSAAEAHCIALIEPRTVMEAVLAVLNRAELEPQRDSSCMAEVRTAEAGGGRSD